MNTIKIKTNTNLGGSSSRLGFLSLGTLLTIVLLYSCQKEKEAPKFLGETSPAMALVYEEPDPELQKLQYLTLTETEQNLIWRDKMAWASKNLPLSQPQEIQINDLIRIIDAGNLFEDNIVFENWKSKAANIFTIRQQYLLFGMIDLFPSTEFTSTNTNSGEYILGGKKCSCSNEGTNDFCGADNWSTPVLSAVHYCHNPCDIPTTRGCGWFWSKACKGDCKVYYHGIGKDPLPRGNGG